MKQLSKKKKIIVLLSVITALIAALTISAVITNHMTVSTPTGSVSTLSNLLTTYKAEISLVLFGLCIVLFIVDVMPMATSAILGCGLMVLFQVCDFKTAFGEFASTTVLMLIGVLIVGAAVAETGVAEIIGKTVSKLSKNNERILLATLFLTAMALSSFLTNVTVLAIFIPIVFSLAKGNSKIKPLNLVIPLTLAVNMGGLLTLAASSQQMTAQGLLEEYGYTQFEMFTFLPFGLILGGASLLYCLFIGLPLGEKIWGKRQLSDVTDKFKNDDSDVKEIDIKKAISISVIFVCMVFFYIYQKIPFTNIKVPIHLTSTISALACIVTGCITQKKAIASVNWDIVGRLAGCLGIAKAITASGGMKLMGMWFLKLSELQFSPFVLFAIVVLLAQVTSLFISNSTAISVSLMIIISISEAFTRGSLAGINVTAYAMGITLAASMGACSPLSGSTWGISMSAGYKFRDYPKYGLPIDILSYLLIIITVPLLMGLTI